MLEALQGVHLQVDQRLRRPAPHSDREERALQKRALEQEKVLPQDLQEVEVEPVHMEAADPQVEPQVETLLQPQQV